jgi:serine/threonine protein kinase
MSADFDKLREVFLAALEQAPDQRECYLDQLCADDQDLRRKVAVMLKAHAAGEGPLDRGALRDQQTGAYEQAAEKPGTVIGPYKLMEPIGEGGMGTVWMAQQTEPVKRLVALKLIKPGMDSKQVLARFEAERQALALMDHPNIARVFDAGTTVIGRPYFVMELVKGVPLTKYCDEHRLTPRERLELFVPVCQAIQHAHQKGIIHRDIKPSNVLVCLYDGKPVPKVIDFGVAKATGQQLTEHTLVTGFGNIVGTLEYMSPEQAEINQLDIDTRSDVYALGVLLFELLTGTTPLERKRLQEVAILELLRLVREEEAPRPSTRLSSTEALPAIAANRGTEPKKLSGLLRGELDWILLKALEKDRDRRYETANGLAHDIARYLNDEAVLACPPSARYRFRKFVRRHRPQVIAAGLVLLVLLGGMVGTTWGLVRAERSQQVAEEKEKEALAEKATALAERDAKDQALAAERQARAQAMSALQALTDDIVENQMARATHLTEENKEFLRKIIKQFEGFAAHTADDAESRAIRAAGYSRVGRMRHRLGEVKEAETAYTDALAILKQLAANFPTRPEFRQNLAMSHLNRGILLRDTGRLKEAETANADALAIMKQLAADFPTRPEYRQDLARGQNNLGILLRDTGRVKEAETAFAEVVAIRKQLAADFPTRPEYRQLLAMSHNNLGLVLGDTGQVKEAERAYTDALAILKQLAADFPTRPEFRQELARTHNSLGLILGVKEAERAYTDALAILKQLAADFPTRPEFRQELARGHNNLGLVLGDTGQVKEAERAYTDALAILKQLTADFPNRPDFRHMLATSHNNLGILLDDTGRVKEAERAYTDALAILKQLAADFPNRPDMRNDLAGTYVNLAILCHERRDFQRAKTYLDHAQPHHEAALKANPQSASYRRFLQNNLIALVQANAGLQDQAAALHAAQKLRDLGWEPRDNAFDAGRALARCIPIVEKEDKSEAAKRRAAVQFYGNQALVMLRAAVARGYQDAQAMKTHSDLDSLRQRDDFKKLLAELTKKSSPRQTAEPSAAPNREE